MSGRRERWGVIGAVLAAVDLEAARNSTGRMTGIAARANIAYDRLQGYLSELQLRGLIAGDPPKLTPKGREFLAQYRRWQEVLKRYGFEPRDEHRVPPVRNAHGAPPTDGLG